MSCEESKSRRSGATSLSFLTTQIAREHPTRRATPYFARGVVARLADIPAICRTHAYPRPKSDIVTGVNLRGPDPRAGKNNDPTLRLASAERSAKLLFMITLRQVTKRYKTQTGTKTVLDQVDFTVSPGESIGVCGHNGAGKSTLLRLVGGVEFPDRGCVERTMTTSWPLGHGSAFQSSLSGADNARFIARVYGLDPRETLDFVDDFAELGPYLAMPVRTYSSGMMARLAFAISLAVQFDCYLIDEITSAGDTRFQAKCHAALMARKQSGALLMVSHDPHTLRDYCISGAILRHGRLSHFDTIDEAIDRHFADGVSA